MSLLDTLEDVEVTKDVDFRRSYVRNGRVYTDKQCLSDLDIYFWYCELDRRVGSYDLDVLKTLAQDAKVVIDPFGFDVGLDKYQAHLRLQRAGVRVAETVLFDHMDVEGVKEVLSDWGMAVLKPRRGCFGKGVTLIESYPTLRDVVEYVYSTTGASPDRGLLERYYENDIDDWVGTTIINGELMYGYRKGSSKIDVLGRAGLKVYDSQQTGGGVVRCDVSEVQARAALKAYKAIGAEIIGFDFVMSNGQPIIVDENTFPGYYEELFEQSGKDPAVEFLKLIEAEIEQKRKRSR